MIYCLIASITILQAEEVIWTNNISSPKHPKSSIDAIFGLRELLETNTELILPSLHTLLGACVRLISDEVSSILVQLHVSYHNIGNRMLAFEKLFCPS
jgi:hypothetical protein